MLRQFFCALVVVTLSTSMLFAAEWTVFHGPKGDNKSPDTGLLKQWSEGGPTLLWKADSIGFGYSGVTVADGRIFTTGNVGDLEMVFCLDMDGKLIWEKDNGAAIHTIADVHPRARNYPGTRGTPTIDGDVVFAVSALGQVTCFNVQNGDKIWSRNLLTDYNAPQPVWVLGHSVVVEGDHLICMVGGAEALAVALNKRTGETVLVYPPAEGNTPTSYMTPYFFDFEGTRVLALMGNASVEGYNAATAEKLFSFPFRNRVVVNVTAPIYRDGHLFVSTGYGYGTEGYRLTKNANGTITATKLWHTEEFDSHHHALILLGDYVYGTSHGGNWMAVNFLTGEIAYRSRPVGEAASVHYADGLIYCLSETSATVILWNPNPNEFVEVSRFVLPDAEVAEGRAWAHPVVIGGRLYLRHAQFLYCYDVRSQ